MYGVITLKAGGSLSLDANENWTLGTGGYFTLLHMAQNSDDSPRFFGANLRITRKVGPGTRAQARLYSGLGLGLTTSLP
jgi:hypothetical protein